MDGFSRVTTISRVLQRAPQVTHSRRRCGPRLLVTFVWPPQVGQGSLGLLIVLPMPPHDPLGPDPKGNVNGDYQ